MLMLFQHGIRLSVSCCTRSHYAVTPAPAEKACVCQVFDSVARDVVSSALDGINGTLFAYGSTGSGKTFTITGGVSRYADRGLIPRAMNLAFTTMAERQECTYEVRY